MSAKDFPVTLGYGSRAYPYGTADFPYHRGVDYGAPEGCPIVVNGVLIGYTGHTGFVTGPHVHVGRWVNGRDTDPSNGGWVLDNPRVTEISYDDTNGNRVALQDAQGVRWVYLHMRELSTVVRVGDYLNSLPAYEETGGKGGEEMQISQEAYDDFVKWKAIGMDAQPYKQRFETATGWHGDPNKMVVISEDEYGDLKEWKANAQAGKPGEPVQELKPGLWRVKE